MTARSEAMRQEKNYQVEVDNFSSPSTRSPWPCSDVKQYAVSGLVGGERKFTTGDVDADPVGCDDIVTIRDTGALAMHRNAR